MNFLNFYNEIYNKSYHCIYWGDEYPYTTYQSDIFEDLGDGGFLSTAISMDGICCEIFI